MRSPPPLPLFRLCPPFFSLDLVAEMRPPPPLPPYASAPAAAGAATMVTAPHLTTLADSCYSVTTPAPVPVVALSSTGFTRPLLPGGSP